MKRDNKVSYPGFSLIELLLVMALIGLLAALIVPALSNRLTNIRLKTSAKKTVAIINYTRTQAIAKKKPFWLVFDREKNRVAVVDQPLEALTESRSSQETSGSPPLSAKVYSYPEEVVVSKLVVGKDEVLDSKTAFIFYPNGSSSGGEIWLKAKSNLFYLITVDPIISTATIEVNEEEFG